MVRNIVLAVSSLAVLVILFVGYTALVGEPAGGRAGRRAVEGLPPRSEPATEPLRVADMVEMPAGGKIVFRRYDERTGRPTDMFRCQDWQPVPGAKNEIRVSRPELAILLPSGMIATISADEGQVTVDRIEQSQMQPKLGWLAGSVRIVVDRETSPDRTPSAVRPEDLITIAVDRLEFDLDIGELKTEDRVTVHSEDFEIAGTGLHLIWSQAENRIETLSIARGEEFVLYAAAGLFGTVTTSESKDVAPPVPTTAEAVAEEKPQRHKRRRRRTTAYACVLDGVLGAEQFRGSERIGGLEADEIHLLFDVGSGADRFLRSESATTAPASRPAREQRDRLVLRWNGTLQLGPTAADPRAKQSRRRFEALGWPVVMTRDEGVVRCGRVAFHDDTQRVWLYPTEDGTVEFGMGDNLSASAQSVYIDRAARVVKLIGDVELRSRRGSGEKTRISSIRSAYWAELHVAETATATQPAVDAMMGAGRLESATFVGDVRVDLGAQRLTSHRLDIALRPDGGGQTLEELLDTATASGDVQLSSGDGKVECGELELAFDMTPDGALYPRRMDAVGSVELTRGQERGLVWSWKHLLSLVGLWEPERGPAYVRGNEVVAELAPPPKDRQPGGPELVIRTLDVLGEAEFIDPQNEVAARGHHIAAVFEGMNRLATTTVSGSAEKPGLVYARPYLVRGGRIDLDRDAQTLHVDGPSRLKFKTRRSLQGQRRIEPTPVIVTSEEMLHVDGRQNEVRFVGDVVAQSGQEQLQGDRLTLLLEDVAEPVPPAGGRSRGPLWAGVRSVRRELRDSRRQARRLGGGKDAPAAWEARDGLFAVRAEGERIRKEPVRLTADNALVASETYVPGNDVPVLEASIRAPLLEVDIVNRQIVTTGLTQLLMLDRRESREAEPARVALGIPSALISRGPSQTAIQCEGQMTYTLGPDGPGRRDTVLFEEAVFFVHRTGTEMVNLEHMLPDVAATPELLDSLRSRNASLDCDRLECWFAVDEGDGSPRRGGALTRAPLRLASLIASGSVYLRDVEGPRIREVYADWVEFGREQRRIEVRGAETADARVYFEDAQTGQFDVHAGKELTINLRDGTIRSGKLAGEMRRP